VSGDGGASRLMFLMFSPAALPPFGELDRALQAHLHEVTLRVIRDEVFADASEAREVPEALSPN
jgi:hypothetical protein